MQNTNCVHMWTKGVNAAQSECHNLSTLCSVALRTKPQSFHYSCKHQQAQKASDVEKEVDGGVRAVRLMVYIITEPQ